MSESQIPSPADVAVYIADRAFHFDASQLSPREGGYDADDAESVAMAITRRLRNDGDVMFKTDSSVEVVFAGAVSRIIVTTDAGPMTM